MENGSDRFAPARFGARRLVAAAASSACGANFDDFNRIRQLEIVFGSPMAASMSGVVARVGGFIGLSLRGECS